MPWYDFGCPNCNTLHDVFARITEISGLTPPCPDCGTPMKRKFRPLNVTHKERTNGLGITRDESEVEQYCYNQIKESEEQKYLLTKKEK